MTPGQIIACGIVFVLVCLLPYECIFLTRLTKQMNKVTNQINNVTKNMAQLTKTTNTLLEDVHKDNAKLQPALKTINQMNTKVQKIRKSIKKHKKHFRMTRLVVRHMIKKRLQK